LFTISAGEIPVPQVAAKHAVEYKVFTGVYIAMAAEPIGNRIIIVTIEISTNGITQQTVLF
jgi:hypothetical protein